MHFGSDAWRVVKQGRAGCIAYVGGFLTFMSIGGFPSFVEDMKVCLCPIVYSCISVDVNLNTRRRGQKKLLENILAIQRFSSCSTFSWGPLKDVVIGK